jgi:biopolymer transport protein ExbB/TolQ
MFELKDANLALRAFVLLGLIGFGFFIAIEQGLVQLALDSDKSYISWVILGLYVLASAHWLWLARTLARERRRFSDLEEALAEERREHGIDDGLLGRLLTNLRHKDDVTEAEVLVTAFGDEIANAHALGHFTSDVLLRLGLLGTIVGFIFMLLPISEMKGFDASMMQQLLTAMSGGMAVALYTTMAGLITSTLLKLQYHILDASAAQLVTRLSVLVDVKLKETSGAPVSPAAG